MIFKLISLRGRRQITFITFNRFCSLAPALLLHYHPVFNRQYSGWMEGQPKIKWKVHAVLNCISSFEGTSCKNVQDTASSSFISWCFTSAFYISRYNFLQLFRTSFNIIWKKCFVTNFPFFNSLTQTLPIEPP